MTGNNDWNDRYRDGDLPWDTGRPSSELQRAVSRNAIQPCRALELGCGTGTNSVWLAQQGFEVTGVDLASLAVERAENRATPLGLMCASLLPMCSIWLTWMAPLHFSSIVAVTMPFVAIQRKTMRRPWHDNFLPVAAA